MAEYLKSNPVTNLDSTPVIVATSGEGAPGHMKVATDVVVPTASVAQWSTYRLCRIPTNAKIKKVQFYTSGIDSNATPTATLDINIAFSDSGVDGTSATSQGTIPSSKHDGTSLPFVNGTGYNTGYANSGTGNKLFGTVTVSASGATQNLEVTYHNTTAGVGFFPANRDDDLWDVLGFVNNSGLPQDPGGFFDIFVVVSAAVATAAAGVIGIEVDYVV